MIIALMMVTGVTVMVKVIGIMKIFRWKWW